MFWSTFTCTNKQHQYWQNCQIKFHRWQFYSVRNWILALSQTREILVGQPDTISMLLTANVQHKFGVDKMEEDRNWDTRDPTVSSKGTLTALASVRVWGHSSTQNSSGIVQWRKGSANNPMHSLYNTLVCTCVYLHYRYYRIWSWKTTIKQLLN